jgi:hypothetical protein
MRKIHSNSIREVEHTVKARSGKNVACIPAMRIHVEPDPDPTIENRPDQCNKFSSIYVLDNFRNIFIPSIDKLHVQNTTLNTCFPEEFFKNDIKRIGISCHD